MGNFKRAEILLKLKGIVGDWVSSVAIRNGVKGHDARYLDDNNESQGDNGFQYYIRDCSNPHNKGGNLYDIAQLRVFGSQRLGCHNASADIDCLCLAPNYVTREDFFSSFVDLLRQRTDTSLVFGVPAAYTPVVKFNLDDQPIDLLFVSLLTPHVPRKKELDISYLKALDHRSIRSINGPRVAEWIVKLVPDENNFRSALQAIKLWAKRRGIFSNVLGFLGGVNYAIMVVFICQRYPSASPATLVSNFSACLFSGSGLIQFSFLLRRATPAKKSEIYLCGIRN